jgi:hypothetical protein
MNVFVSNPLRVSLGDVSYVFVGGVPPNVKAALKKSPTASDAAILKKFYGPQWAQKLAIGGSSGGGSSGGGSSGGGDGDAENAKDDIEEAAEDEIAEFLREETDGMPDGVIDDVFVADEAKQTSGVQFVFFPEIHPNDTVTEFKHKLFVATGVPPFRQHLWFSAGRHRAVAYQTFVPEQVAIDINRLSSAELVDGIPVLPEYDQYRDMKIRDYDEFTVMDAYYHRGVLSFNLTDLGTYVDPTNVNHAAIARDRNKTEIIYYGLVLPFWPMLTIHAFEEYLKGSIASQYPNLSPTVEELTARYKIEKKITDTQYAAFEDKALHAIQSRLESSITYAVISMLRNPIDGSVVYLRNLFDALELSPHIPMCRCVDKGFTLDKVHRSGQRTREKTPPNCILIKIFPTPGYMQYINLHLYKNGNYIIKSHWREESNYSFADVFEVVSAEVNALLAKINRLGDSVVKEHLISISKTNVKFTEINTSVIYRKALTTGQFALIRQMIADHTAANMMILNEDNVAVRVFFTKGMYQHDPALVERLTEDVDQTNSYARLSDGVMQQKWHMLFTRTHLTTFTHRFADLKVDVVGVKDDEFPTFYRTVVGMLYALTKSSPEPSTKLASKKAIRNLKEQDPVLYDARRLFKRGVVYSKMCQRPHQPSLLTEEKYEGLPTKDKGRAVKFWNFTTQKPAYYICPNPKYPYVKFFINKHPKGYCIPCCQKIPVPDDKANYKRIIYDMCIKEHKSATKHDATTATKYIMSYGKDIAPGRISRLPESTLEPLFYETYSAEYQGIDKECESNEGFYLYGVEQSTPQFSHLGFLYCLANAMDIETHDVVALFASRVTPAIFNNLLNGQARLHMDHAAFIDALNGMLSSKPSWRDDRVPWNEMLIEIASSIYEINVVLFTHEGSEFLIELPPGLMNVEKHVDPSKKNLVILRRNQRYYPIYWLNVDVFFRTGLIDQKIFSHGSSIMLITNSMIRKYLAVSFHPKGVMHPRFDLYALRTYASETKNKISTLFIDTNNMCYYATINGIHVPVELSHWGSGDASYDLFTRTKAPSFAQLNELISLYNKWATGGDEPRFAPIRVHEWVVLGKKVIGFSFHRMTFYFTPITLAAALKLKKTHVRTLLYDPDQVNAAIFAAAPSKPDPRTRNLVEDYRQYTAYSRFLVKFMLYFGRARNKKVRLTLKKVLAKDKIDSDRIAELVSGDDLHRIRRSIAYMLRKGTKKALLEEIDESKYAFDDVERRRIEEADPAAAKKEVARLAARLVPDIPKAQRDEFVDIIASDLSDPARRAMVFSGILVDPAMRYLRFIDRPMEDIFVSKA